MTIAKVVRVEFSTDVDSDAEVRHLVADLLRHELVTTVLSITVIGEIDEEEYREGLG